MDVRCGLSKMDQEAGDYEFKKFEDDPYEKRAFLYLDIISWLESKIVGPGNSYEIGRASCRERV